MTQKVSPDVIDTLITNRSPQVLAYACNLDLGEWIAVDTMGDTIYANHLQTENECIEWLERNHKLTDEEKEIVTALVMCHFAELGEIGMADREKERRIIRALGRLT